MLVDISFLTDILMQNLLDTHDFRTHKCTKIYNKFLRPLHYPFHGSRMHMHIFYQGYQELNHVVMPDFLLSIIGVLVDVSRDAKLLLIDSLIFLHLSFLNYWF